MPTCSLSFLGYQDSIAVFLIPFKSFGSRRLVLFEVDVRCEVMVVVQSRMKEREREGQLATKRAFRRQSLRGKDYVGHESRPRPIAADVGVTEVCYWLLPIREYQAFAPPDKLSGHFALATLFFVEQWRRQVGSLKIEKRVSRRR